MSRVENPEVSAAGFGKELEGGKRGGLKPGRYPRYRPSGIDWLGDVPEHWEVKRSDSLIFSERNQVSPSDFSDQEVFHYSIPAVQENGTGQIEEGNSISSAKFLIREPSVLVSKLNPRKATICRAEPQGILTICSTEFVILKSKKVDLRFLEYFVRNELFRQGLDSKVQSVTRSHQRANPVDITRFWNAWPPLSAQERIVEFLDVETGRIDGLISKKGALVERLREKRMALISRTVTRGLPADISAETVAELEELAGIELPLNPPLKPSGIEWLGEIPEHWEVKRLKIVSDLIDRRTDDFDDNPLPYVGLENVESWTGRVLSLNEEMTSVGVSGHFQRGEVLFGKLRPYLAKGFVADFEGYCSTEFLIFNSKLLDNYFLQYFLLNVRFIDFVNSSTFGTRMPRANWEFVGNSDVPVPPKPEQVAIARYLDLETGKIDRLISKIEATVERLREYRTALITAVVTGKVRV